MSSLELLLLLLDQLLHLLKLSALIIQHLHMHSSSFLQTQSLVGTPHKHPHQPEPVSGNQCCKFEPKRDKIVMQRRTFALIECDQTEVPHGDLFSDMMDAEKVICYPCREANEQLTCCYVDRPYPASATLSAPLLM